MSFKVIKLPQMLSKNIDRFIRKHKDRSKIYNYFDIEYSGQTIKYKTNNYYRNGHGNYTFNIFFDYTENKFYLLDIEPDENFINTINAGYTIEKYDKNPKTIETILIALNQTAQYFDSNILKNILDTYKLIINKVHDINGNPYLDVGFVFYLRQRYSSLYVSKDSTTILKKIPIKDIDTIVNEIVSLFKEMIKLDKDGKMELEQLEKLKDINRIPKNIISKPTISKIPTNTCTFIGDEIEINMPPNDNAIIEFNGNDLIASGSISEYKKIYINKSNNDLLILPIHLENINKTVLEETGFYIKNRTSIFEIHTAYSTLVVKLHPCDIPKILEFIKTNYKKPMISGTFYYTTNGKLIDVYNNEIVDYSLNYLLKENINYVNIPSNDKLTTYDIYGL